MSISLTDEQNDAVKQIKIWFDRFRSSDQEPFILGGYAGTGKSTLLAFIIDHLGLNMDDVHFCAFTGKASLVLNKKGLPATTIHRLLYIPYEDKDGKIKFKKNPVLDPNLKLIVVDEASTVYTKLKNDLEYHGIPVLYVGDCYQLPPVSSDLTNLMLNPNCVLKTIHRQAAGNPIIAIAHAIRDGKTIVNGTYGDSVMKVSKSKMKDVWLSDVDQVLCGKNDTRHSLNSFIRKTKGINSPYPVVGDKMVCLKNDNESGLVNGMIGECTYFHLKDWEMSFTNDDAQQWNKLCIEKKVFDKVKEIKYSKEIQQFDYGNVLTVHKCLTGTTYLFSDRGILHLKDLDSNSKLHESKVISEVGIHNGEYIESPSHFINNGTDLCNKITTKKGFFLEGTHPHKVDVLVESGVIIQKTIKELVVGDVMVLCSGMETYGNNEDIPVLYKETGFEYDIRTVVYNRPTKITASFARFLGYMVADGTLTKKGFKFSKKYKEVVDDFKSLVEELFDYTNGKIVFRKSGDYMYEVSSIYIADFLSTIGGIQPHTKYIPDCIMRSCKEYQCEFLKAVFEDGTVNMKQTKTKIRFDHVEISAKDFGFIYQIKMLLLNMGIITTNVKYTNFDKKYNVDRTSYALYIYGANAFRFKSNIGFISNFKNDRLNDLIDVVFCSKDTIPYITSILRTISKRYRMSFEKKYKQMIGYDTIGYARLGEVLEVMKQYDEIETDSDFLYLVSLLTRGLFFDKIINIEQDIISDTYCLTMPETHKFVQNGFCGWNSQGSQFPSVLVMEETLGRDEEMHRRWLYTAVTRASESLIMVGR